ncbi:Av71 muscle cell intermediate filament [Culex quinquefasciatus]|uniref:Av71 muscle cell intermediate filament n=1 Tax=Culex quinquefasciatus TaxID=7176 RepID=B0WID0_CULQU|nr:Av71 muscle cell intermediate filament [Culex quinquefasciatus]|eukprot:XP_001848464.1 Av71 muscle cell intermediate filament [Culex quinquefasciatus]
MPTQTISSQLFYPSERENKERVFSSDWCGSDKRLSRSQESGVKSQESRVKSQESRVKSQQSRVKSQESRVKSQESRVKSQESRVKSQESRVKSQESRVKSQESRVKSQESRVKSQESRVKSQQSPVRSQESRVKSQERRPRRRRRFVFFRMSLVPKPAQPVCARFVFVNFAVTARCPFCPLAGLHMAHMFCWHVSSDDDTTTMGTGPAASNGFSDLQHVVTRVEVFNGMFN